MIQAMSFANYLPSTWGTYGATTFDEFAEAISGYRPSDILPRVAQWARQLEEHQRKHGAGPFPVVLPRHVSRNGQFQGINVANHLLALMARMSLLRGSELAPGVITDDSFLRLLRNGCELWDTADTLAEPGYELRVMYEQAPFQEALWQPLPRAKLMYLDAWAALEGPAMDIDAEFRALCGLSIEDFVSIGFAMFAQLATDPIFYPLVGWSTSVSGLRDVVTKENTTAFLKIVAADQQRFRTEDAATRPTGIVESRYDFNPLAKYPIVDLGNAMCMAPIRNLVVWRLYTAPFHELADAFREAGGKNRFRAFFGQVFQSYVGLLLRDALPAVDIFPELGDEAVGPVDWVVRVGSHAVLIECRTGDFPLPAKSSGDPKLVEDGLRKIAVDTIEKIPAKIAGLQKNANEYGLSGIGTWHVLVVLKEPLLPVARMRQLIDAQLNEPVAYHLLATGDFEQLMALHDAVGIHQILSDKAGRTEMDKDFRTFFHEHRNAYKFRRNPLLERTSDELFAKLSAAGGSPSTKP